MVDFLSHALWAYALFHNDPRAPAFALLSLLPDLVWAVPALAAYLWNGLRTGRFLPLRKLPHEEASRLPYFAFVRNVYSLSHSWLGWLVLASLVSYFDPELFTPLFAGVYLHLALDLFTHRHSLGGQRPLYPASDWRVEGFVHWSEARFLIANYGLLTLIYLLIFAGAL
jgi:membrane-bound metal-dependent hydrolase YbcI (DUF457 family)